MVTGRTMAFVKKILFFFFFILDHRFFLQHIQLLGFSFLTILGIYIFLLYYLRQFSVFLCSFFSSSSLLLTVDGRKYAVFEDLIGLSLVFFSKIVIF